jgi:hypothetical protein
MPASLLSCFYLYAFSLLSELDLHLTAMVGLVSLSLYLSVFFSLFFFCLYSHSIHLDTVSKELLLIMQGKQRKK